MTALRGILRLTYHIEVITGLKIGGAKESIEIGGIDNVVIKLKHYKGRSDVPYIPGSSVKGKVRSLIELALGIFNGPCACGSDDCKVCKLFGTAGDKARHPVRLRVSDFYPTDETIDMWESFLEGVYTEIKAENTINRLTSTVKQGGLRHMERVIPGSVFYGTVSFRVFEKNDKDLFELFEQGLKLVEEDYLGGCGSRGYGRVKFNLVNVEYKAINSANGSFKVEIKPNINLENFKEEVFKASLAG